MVKQPDHDGRIILILGIIAAAGFVALIMAELFVNHPVDADPVLAIVAGAVGALSSRLTAGTPVQTANDMQLLGAAVNRQMIAATVRSMTDTHEVSNPEGE